MQVEADPVVDSGASNNPAQDQELLRRRDEQEEYFEFTKLREKAKILVADWQTEVKKTRVRRDLRKSEIDVDAARDSEELLEDETIISIRTIDENIRREQPAYVSFLTQSNRLISFTDKLSPVDDTTLLENEFSKGMKYHGWELPWYREFDGCQLHGWDAIEVLIDKTKPLNVGIEHIGHDKFYFPLDCIDIQNAPYCAREYDMTRVQLQRMIRSFGFVKSETDKLIDHLKVHKQNISTIKVFKVYFKYDGLVYVAWLTVEDGIATDWLKPPAKFYNGVRTKNVTLQDQVDPQSGAIFQVPVESWTDVFEESYPIFILRYNETEELRITECKGRAFFDVNKQEAQTAVVSGFINCLNRSTNVYACAKTPNGSGVLKYQSDLNLQNGRVLTEPVEFFTSPIPDAASILGGLEYLEKRNSAEIGQMTDLLRKKKERQTRFEYEVASQDTAMLSSVQMTLLSMHIRDVYTYSWRIVQSQALQGLVALLVQAIPRPGVFKNNDAIIMRDYDIRSAGDVEVTQKLQRISKMFQMWPIVANTPLATVFLVDMLKIMFPESGQKYEMLLQQGDQGKAIVLSLMTVLEGILKAHPEEFTTMQPQEQQQFLALKQQAQMYLSNGQQQGGQPNQQPTQQPQTQTQTQ